MDRAVIGERAGLRKGELEGLTGLQKAGVPDAVVASRSMLGGPLIRPDDCGAGGNGDGYGLKLVVDDGDVRGVRAYGVCHSHAHHGYQDCEG